MVLFLSYFYCENEKGSDKSAATAASMLICLAAAALASCRSSSSVVFPGQLLKAATCPSNHKGS